MSTSTPSGSRKRVQALLKKHARKPITIQLDGTTVELVPPKMETIFPLLNQATDKEKIGTIEGLQSIIMCIDGVETEEDAWILMQLDGGKELAIKCLELTLGKQEDTSDELDPTE